MLLTDAQREVVDQIQQAVLALGNEVGRLTDLMREVRRRDQDLSGMNPTSETATDLLNRAKARYTVLRTAAITAANALPNVT